MERLNKENLVSAIRQIREAMRSEFEWIQEEKEKIIEPSCTMWAVSLNLCLPLHIAEEFDRFLGEFEENNSNVRSTEMV